MTTTTTAAVMRKFRFNLHGIELHYQTTSQAFVAPVLSLLRPYHVDRVKGETVLTVRFEGVAGRAEVPVQVSDQARTLFSGTCPSRGDSLRSIWRCDVIQDGDRLLTDFHEHGLLVLDGINGVAEGYFVKPDVMHEDFRENLFLYALTELLKRRGYFALHATALEWQGHGVLIPGGNGRGKTTAFLSLLRSGFRYLSDDIPLLRDRGTHMEVLPFPMKVDVTDRTIGFFPELKHAAAGILRQGVWKKSFQPEDVYPDSLGAGCRPAMILIPHISDIPHSCLEPLSKSRALQEILPQERRGRDSTVARREFGALSKLMQQADCYRLHFGSDVLDLPKLVIPLLGLRKSA